MVQSLRQPNGGALPVACGSRREDRSRSDEPGRSGDGGFVLSACPPARTPGTEGRDRFRAALSWPEHVPDRCGGHPDGTALCLRGREPLRAGGPAAGGRTAGDADQTGARRRRGACGARRRRPWRGRRTALYALVTLRPLDLVERRRGRDEDSLPRRASHAPARWSRRSVGGLAGDLGHAAQARFAVSPTSDEREPRNALFPARRMVARAMGPDPGGGFFRHGSDLLGRHERR